MKKITILFLATFLTHAQLHCAAHQDFDSNDEGSYVSSDEDPCFLTDEDHKVLILINEIHELKENDFIQIGELNEESNNATRIYFVVSHTHCYVYTFDTNSNDLELLKEQQCKRLDPISLSSTDSSHQRFAWLSLGGSDDKTHVYFCQHDQRDDARHQAKMALDKVRKFKADAYYKNDHAESNEQLVEEAEKHFKKWNKAVNAHKKLQRCPEQPNVKIWSTDETLTFVKLMSYPPQP